MIVLYYILLYLCSLGLAVPLTELQHCYVHEQPFTLEKLGEHLRKSPVAFIVFGLLFAGGTTAAILTYSAKGLNMVVMPQYLLMWECMLVGAWIDFKVKKIPNLIFVILLAGRCIGLLVEMAMYPDNLIAILLDAIPGMLIGGIIVLACRLLSRGGVGAGDVKLFAMIGLYFGVVYTLNILFYTTFIAAFVAIVLLVSKKAKMKSTLAFGPFAFIGINIFYILLERS